MRAQFIDALKAAFPSYPLIYAVGGQISFDIFPPGWDKTYCLQHVEMENWDEIHFFGDKTYKVSRCLCWRVPLRRELVLGGATCSSAFARMQAWFLC